MQKATTCPRVDAEYGYENRRRRCTKNSLWMRAMARASLPSRIIAKSVRPMLVPGAGGSFLRNSIGAPSSASRERSPASIASRMSSATLLRPFRLVAATVSETFEYSIEARDCKEKSKFGAVFARVEIRDEGRYLRVPDFSVQKANPTHIGTPRQSAAALLTIPSPRLPDQNVDLLPRPGAPKTRPYEPPLKFTLKFLSPFLRNQSKRNKLGRVAPVPLCMCREIPGDYVASLDRHPTGIDRRHRPFHLQTDMRKMHPIVLRRCDREALEEDVIALKDAVEVRENAGVDRAAHETVGGANRERGFVPPRPHKRGVLVRGPEH